MTTTKIFEAAEYSSTACKALLMLCFIATRFKIVPTTAPRKLNRNTKIQLNYSNILSFVF